MTPSPNHPITPTDEQIVSALRRAGEGSPTYVVKNWLRSKEFGGFKNLKTSHVLYRLRKLQARGLVAEVKTPYFVFMKSWGIANHPITPANEGVAA